MTSSLTKLNKHPVASTIDTVMENQNSSAIVKIPRFIQNANFEPKPISLDECFATIVHHNLSADVYRQLTKRVNGKIKSLNWELEKFRVRKEFQFSLSIYRGNIKNLGVWVQFIS